MNLKSASTVKSQLFTEQLSSKQFDFNFYLTISNDSCLTTPTQSDQFKLIIPKKIKRGGSLKAGFLPDDASDIVARTVYVLLKDCSSPFHSLYRNMGGKIPGINWLVSENI